MSTEIAGVYLFHNGMMMVFGKNGRQMPELQGPYQETIEKLLKMKYEGPIAVGSWRPGR